jgi:phage terminase large subunit-like protein
LNEWSTACPDWESRIAEGRSLVPFGPLFQAEAQSALKVFNALRMVDVAGAPTMGEICRPWIVEFAQSVFGAYDRAVGRQLISEFLLCVSKKNGKSSLAAAIMLTALIRNWRESAEFLILAPTIEIANNSFIPARDMIRKDEELSDLLHVQDHYRTITHREKNATLKVVAADNETVSGKKATGVLIDELWLFGKRANAEGMLREATGGLASRPEGFTIYLTTHADEAPAGVFRKKLQYARGVRDGRIEDKRFQPVLYEYPKQMLERKAFRERKYWFITNPNFGASVDPEFIEHQLKEADEAGEESLVGFYAKHLNVEIGLALRSDRWSGADFWEDQATLLSLDDLLERSEVVTIGIDGGGLDDLLGLAVIGRESGTGNWLHWAHAWVHESGLEKRKSEAPRMRDFEKADELTIVKQMGEDVEQLVAFAKKVNESGLLDRIGVDPAGIASVTQALEEAEIPTDRIIGISQGWKLVGAIKSLERKLAEGAFWHGGSALMAWSVGNAKVEPKGNAILITKQASGTAKIDPLMATFDAVALMATNPQARGRFADFLANPIIA